MSICVKLLPGCGGATPVPPPPPATVAPPDTGTCTPPQPPAHPTTNNKQPPNPNPNSKALATFTLRTSKPITLSNLRERLIRDENLPLDGTEQLCKRKSDNTRFKPTWCSPEDEVELVLGFPDVAEWLSFLIQQLFFEGDVGGVVTEIALAEVELLFCYQYGSDFGHSARALLGENGATQLVDFLKSQEAYFEINAGSETVRVLKKLQRVPLPELKAPSPALNTSGSCSGAAAAEAGGLRNVMSPRPGAGVTGETRPRPDEQAERGSAADTNMTVGGRTSSEVGKVDAARTSSLSETIATAPDEPPQPEETAAEETGLESADGSSYRTASSMYSAGDKTETETSERRSTAGDVNLLEGVSSPEFSDRGGCETKWNLNAPVFLPSQYRPQHVVIGQADYATGTITAGLTAAQPDARLESYFPRSIHEGSGPENSGGGARRNKGRASSEADDESSDEENAAVALFELRHRATVCLDSFLKVFEKHSGLHIEQLRRHGRLAHASRSTVAEHVTCHIRDLQNPHICLPMLYASVLAEGGRMERVCQKMSSVEKFHADDEALHFQLSLCRDLPLRLTIDFAKCYM